MKKISLKMVIRAVKNQISHYEVSEETGATETEIMTALKKEYDLGFGDCALIAAEFAIFFKSK